MLLEVVPVGRTGWEGQLNLTRERVWQIKEQALDRLRGKQYGTMLKALQEESALY